LLGKFFLYNLIILEFLLPKPIYLKIENLHYNFFPKKEVKEVQKPKIAKIIMVPEKINLDSHFYSEASSFAAIDLETETVIAEKESTKKLPIASLTKLMTAHLALSNLSLDQKITIKNINLGYNESRMGLKQGEIYTTQALLYGLLIQSANDASKQLAIEMAGSEQEFAKMMNNEGKKMGLKNTNFVNSTGNDESEHYSTAYDLFILTRELLKNPIISEIVSTKEILISSEGGRQAKLENTNKILDNEVVFGIKTGTTDQAGECLAVLSKVNGRKIIIIFLGSQDRFEETINIINWIKENIIWKEQKIYTNQ
jgi:serine-type D-Ala-D-Ala carboxypeptidase (penicillin-binding protein 5/6)